MKHLKTLTLATGLFTATLITLPVQAAEVKTAGQAMSLCTAQAKATHSDYKRSKSTKIKQRRGVFKIKLKVITESGSVNSLCEVTKEGSVTYSEG